jgi:tRNA-specific 2-thiouridylase
VSPLDDGGAGIVLDAPLRDVTPGQAAVFYRGEQALGNGLILREG